MTKRWLECKAFFLLTSFTSDAVFFVFLFLEGSGQSPKLFYSVRTGIDEDAAKDMANARLQLCMFAITITMVTKDNRQSREIARRGVSPSLLGCNVSEGKCLFE